MCFLHKRTLFTPALQLPASAPVRSASRSTSVSWPIDRALSAHCSDVRVESNLMVGSSERGGCSNRRHQTKGFDRKVKDVVVLLVVLWV